MSTAPHHDDDHNNDEDRNHGDDERARIENAAAQLRVPVATMRSGAVSVRCQRQPVRRVPFTDYRPTTSQPSGSGSDKPVRPMT